MHFDKFFKKKQKYYYYFFSFAINDDQPQKFFQNTFVKPTVKNLGV